MVPEQESSMSQCEVSVRDAGWFRWFGIWLHTLPWESGFERPHYIIGTARDVCLLQGLETGEAL
jgi:hypothetical protein